MQDATRVVGQPSRRLGKAFVGVWLALGLGVSALGVSTSHSTHVGLKAEGKDRATHQLAGKRWGRPGPHH